MINRLCCLFLALVLLLSLPAPAARAQEQSTTVTGLERVVIQRTSINPEWHNSQLGALLTTGDAVQTGDDSRAELTYPDGTVLRMAENTTLTLQRRENALIQLLIGKLWVRIKKGTGQRVVTPSAVAAAMGTEFLIEVLEDRSTVVTVLEGTIDLIGTTLNDRMPVPAGSQGRVPLNQAVTRPIPVDLDSLRQRERSLLDRDFGRAFTGQEPPVQVERPPQRPPERPPEPPPRPPEPPVTVQPSPPVERRQAIGPDELPFEIKMRNVPIQLDLDRIIVPARRGSPRDLGAPTGDLPVIIK